MAWFALIFAGCMEVFGAINLKRLADKKWDAAIYLVLLFGLSFTLLSYAFQTVSMGTAYAIWTGIGTVGTTVLGMVLYGEPKDWKRIICIGLILGAAIGLKLIS
jgi:paired small multidrug resistance pump